MIEGEGFFDRPFPSDTRMLDGHPDYSGFPYKGEVELLDKYLQMTPRMDGFGTNSPLFVRFTEAIDPSLLPSPFTSIRPDSSVMLLDIDPDSPYRGSIVPLSFQWTEEETRYQPANLLAIAPLAGFPLHPATTYALVLRAPVASKTQDTAVSPELEATWRSLNLDPDTISLATSFTTQDPLKEMGIITDTIHNQLGLPAWEPELALLEELSWYRTYTGYVTVPIWQAGDRPYRETGGAFQFDEHGMPILQGWERVKFALTVPIYAEPPPGGWPLVLYAHGTGGDYLTFTDDEGPVVAKRGCAMFGISQPLHADRAPEGTSPELDSFNYLNPDAGRTNFRQGALDLVYLATLLTQTPPEFQYQDEPVLLNTSLLSYFGHSQGGLSGGLAAPFMSEHIRAAGFSGAGGVLSMTIELRKDPFDIAQLMADLLEFDAGEVVNPMHPVVGLVQSLVEPSDPINMAPYWFAEDLGRGGKPLQIILTEGLLDEYTPSVTTEALAAAAHIPLVSTPATDPIALQIRGFDHALPLPVSANQLGWTGEAVTAGLAQYPEDGHFAIYYNEKAMAFYQEFLATAPYGLAVLQEQ
jgi:hypothetical protein